MKKLLGVTSWRKGFKQGKIGAHVQWTLIPALGQFMLIVGFKRYGYTIDIKKKAAEDV